MKSMVKFLAARFCCLTLLLWPSFGYSQSKKTTSVQTASAPSKVPLASSLLPEVLSAKVILEDLLVRRYSQDLATRLSKESFSVSAKVELEPKPIEEIPAIEPLNDLSLGTLDPEALTQKITASGNEDFLSHILAENRIRVLRLSVGMSPDLGEPKRTEIQNWLQQRLKIEFGNQAQTEVHLIEILKSTNPESKDPSQEQKKQDAQPSSFYEYLKQLQELAGQALVALGLILGALLWGLLSRPKSNPEAASLSIKNETQLNQDLSKQKKDSEEGGPPETLETEIPAATLRQLDDLRRKIQTLYPQIQEEIKELVRVWTFEKEEGYKKIVLLADSVGTEVGKLPLPEDVISDITTSFRSMNAISIQDRKKILDQLYWDLLTVLNLGAGPLNKPFSYVSGLKSEQLSQILISENPKLQTIVSFYMPDKVRQSYLETLDISAKQKLIEQAAELNEVDLDEVKKTDQSLLQQVLQRSGQTQSIKMDLTLRKIITSLTPLDEIKILGQMNQSLLTQYRLQYPSLAFLDQWQDSSLKSLVSKMTVDEVVVYLRLKPDQKERFLAQAAKMTVEMAQDELKRPDSKTDVEKNKILRDLSKKIEKMVTSREIVLSQVFSASTPDSNGQSGPKAA